MIRDQHNRFKFTEKVVILPNLARKIRQTQVNEKKLLASYLMPIVVVPQRIRLGQRSSQSLAMQELKLCLNSVSKESPHTLASN